MFLNLHDCHKNKREPFCHVASSFKALLIITLASSYLAGVLPVHGVDGGAGVHVHQVVVVVAGHHAPAPAHPLVELHGGGVDCGARHCGVRAVAPPASYLDTWPAPGGRSTGWRGGGDSLTCHNYPLMTLTGHWSAHHSRVS